MLLKLGKSFGKAGKCSWVGGREGRRQWGSFTWFQVSGQNFYVSNSFDSPETTSQPGIQNTGFVCKAGAARQKNGILRQD